MPLQRLTRPPFRPPLVRGRRLPPVPTELAHSPSRTPLDYYPCEYEQRSRSPSPCSVYSLSSHYRRSRLRRLPAVIAPPPVTPFVLPPLHPQMAASFEQIRLPTLSHSPTIPHPDTSSPATNFNFPHLCTSPTHGTPTSQNTSLYA